MNPIPITPAAVQAAEWPSKQPCDRLLQQQQDDLRQGLLQRLNEEEVIASANKEEKVTGDSDSQSRSSSNEENEDNSDGDGSSYSSYSRSDIEEQAEQQEPDMTKGYIATVENILENAQYASNQHFTTAFRSLSNHLKELASIDVEIEQLRTEIAAATEAEDLKQQCLLDSLQTVQ